MNILAYNWRDLAHPRAGGAEVYLQSVAREWVAGGHEVTIFCAAVDRHPEYDEWEGVHIVRRGSRLGVYREARRYWEETAKAKTDLVVDSVNTRPFMTPRFVRDVPAVAIFHQLAREIWFAETPLPVAVLGRYVLEPKWLRLYREFPVATVSQSSRESLERYGVRQVTVIPEGFEPFVRPRTPKESRPTLVFLGRLSANKRPDHAVDAFRIIRTQLPEAQMWVIGDGPMRVRLERSAPPGVAFLGRVNDEDKYDRLARAHLLVATSIREGWGLGVTEAAYVGTPAVGYDVPGLRDSVAAHGGAAVAPSPEALAARAALVLTNETPLSASAGEGAVRSWGEVAGRLLAIASAGAAR